ncbi:MAG: hypothetical protein HQL32_02440, partial [Planctomycetes bacterium]|nr:hypothetical protein [Planctomycetota bacterium]
SIKESFIPYAASVYYPDNWDMISNRQEKEFQKQERPEWELELEQKLEKYLSYNCPGLPLAEVLSQLSELSGLNILLDPKVLAEKDEADLELGEFNYGNMKLKHILQWVVRAVDLVYVLKFDVVFVTVKGAGIEKLVMRPYDVQDLLHQNKVYTPPELNQGAITAEDIETEIEFDEVGEGLDQEPLTGDVILDMIRESISGDWDDENGIGVLLKYLDTGVVLVKNSGEVQDMVVELLGTLRKSSSLQMEVEARLLTIEKGFFREIGFDWKGLNNASVQSTGEEAGFRDRSAKDYTVVGTLINGLVPSSATSTLGFFLEHSILDQFQAKVLLRALEGDSSSVQLIAPKVVLMNNIMGYIRLGRSENYISGYGAGSEEGGGGGGGNNNTNDLTPIITSIDEGQLLSVVATASSDRKYITMKVRPDFQEVTFPRPPVIMTGTNFLSTGSIFGDATISTFSLPIMLPTVSKTKIRTTAVIPDRGVLIIGGTAQSREEQRERGVPILSKVPLFGRLFRSDHNSDSSQDTMLLMHGKIILFEELEASL